MDTVKHVVHKERESVVPTFEWKLESGDTRGVALWCCKTGQPDKWMLILDATSEEGYVQVNAARLRPEGVKVIITQ